MQNQWSNYYVILFVRWKLQHGARGTIFLNKGRIVGYFWPCICQFCHLLHNIIYKVKFIYSLFKTVLVKSPGSIVNLFLTKNHYILLTIYCQGPTICIPC